MNFYNGKTKKSEENVIFVLAFRYILPTFVTKKKERKKLKNESDCQREIKLRTVKTRNERENKEQRKRMFIFYLKTDKHGFLSKDVI